jgi:hypothetical protein
MSLKLSAKLAAVADLVCAGKRRAYTDVGCYPVFYLVTDGREEHIYCPWCCEETTDDDLTIVGAQPNWEDPDLECAECGSRIESAYAEKENAK